MSGKFCFRHGPDRVTTSMGGHLLYISRMFCAVKFFPRLRVLSTSVFTMQNRTLSVQFTSGFDRKVAFLFSRPE